MWGNISLNISSVNQLDMPAPGAKEQDAACAEHLESDGVGAEGAGVDGVQGDGVDGVGGLEGLKVGDVRDGDAVGAAGVGPALPEHLQRPSTLHGHHVC